MIDLAPALPKRILVTDDDPSILRLVTTILTRAGYNVEMANGGREALEKIATTRFDVVVLDLMMPEVSGFEVLRCIADRNLGRRFVIVMSAASTEVVENAIGGNVFAALRKPFDIAAMEDAVRNCIIAGGEPRLPSSTLLRKIA